VSPAQQRTARVQMLVMCIAVVVAGFAVLMPLSGELLHRGTNDHMMSDGSDPRGLLWGYRILEWTFHNHPTRLLYGAVYTDMMNAPNGHMLWMPWCERILVPLLAPVTRDATLATAIGWALLSFNGLAMLWMGRVFRWSSWITLAAALGFAITPFTRGRVSVHMALAGIYYLPLVIGGLELVARWKPAEGTARKTALTAMFAFFGACTAAHYHLVITLLLMPFLAIFFVMRARRTDRHLFGRRTTLLIAAAALPTAFLAFQFAVPIPPAMRNKISAFPEANPQLQMQYLQDVGAHPIDYVTGDVKFGEADIIPTRSALTHWVLTHMDRSHPHERANGIRWSLLAVGAIALLHRLLRRNQMQHGPPRAATAAWILLAAFAFLMSLSPRGLVMYGEEYAPALIANKFLPNFRVPSRFGPVVNFAVVAVVADYITELVQRQTRLQPWIGRILGTVVTIAVIVEFVPKTQMLSAYIRPVLPVSQADKSCGTGVFVPFTLWDYWAFEETRGTRCGLLNPTSETAGYELERHIGNRNFAAPAEQDAMVDFAKCTGMAWISFRGNVPEVARKAICGRLEWPMVDELSCHAVTVPQVQRDWHECVR
jgi:hypothetical protein